MEISLVGIVIIVAIFLIWFLELPVHHQRMGTRALVLRSRAASSPVAQRRWPPISSSGPSKPLYRIPLRIANARDVPPQDIINP